MKILLIEDDGVFAQTLKRRLEKHGYQCQHADNGKESLLISRQFLPEVILLDLNLNLDSGLNYIEMLKNILPKSRIILLTGFASIATAVQAIKKGADEYLAKPVDFKTLIAAINNANISSLEEVDNFEDDMLSSEQLEWEHIQQSLKFNDGNVSATARQLSMHRRTLQRKLQKRPSFNQKQ